jgi:serine/threonine protein phosphatase PrpC
MIPVDRAHLEVVAATHPGEVRTTNEDRFAVGTYQLSAQDPTPCTLAILCDGIGGHAAGEVAAQIIVDQYVREAAEFDGRDPTLEVSTALVRAGRAVYARARSDASLYGMGATAATAWVIGNRLYTATIGDSRIYLLRADGMRQVSVDHTYVQEAVERGTLTLEEARTHPYAHVLRRHLGGERDPMPDLRLRLSPDEDDAVAIAHQGLPLAAGEIALLCTDGLSDLVQVEEIGEALLARPLSQAVAHLIDTARARGGHDNITIIALRHP